MLLTSIPSSDSKHLLQHFVLYISFISKHKFSVLTSFSFHIRRYVWSSLCTDQWQVIQGWCTSKSMIVFTESGQHVLLFFPPLSGVLLQLQHNTDSALRRWNFNIWALINMSYSFEKHTWFPKMRMQASALSSCSNSLSFSLSAKGCWIWIEQRIQHILFWMDKGS